jgi:hypothetical protein
MDIAGAPVTASAAGYGLISGLHRGLRENARGEPSRRASRRCARHDPRTEEAVLRGLTSKEERSAVLRRSCALIAQPSPRVTARAPPSRAELLRGLACQRSRADGRAAAGVSPVSNRRRERSGQRQILVQELAVPARRGRGRPRCVRDWRGTGASDRGERIEEGHSPGGERVCERSEHALHADREAVNLSRAPSRRFSISRSTKAEVARGA